MGQWRKAITALNQSIQLNPNQALIHTALGVAYQHESQYPSAIQAFQQAITIEPNSTLAHEHLGEVYLLTQQLDLAEQERDTLLTLKPASGDKLAQSIQKAREEQNASPAKEEPSESDVSSESDTVTPEAEMAEAEAETTMDFTPDHYEQASSSSGPITKFQQTMASLGIGVIVLVWLLSTVLYFALTLIAAETKTGS
jgi:Tfp pilus assembly protein PilF